MRLHYNIRRAFVNQKSAPGTLFSRFTRRSQRALETKLKQTALRFSVPLLLFGSGVAPRNGRCKMEKDEKFWRDIPKSLVWKLIVVYASIAAALIYGAVTMQR